MGERVRYEDAAVYEEPSADAAASPAVDPISYRTRTKSKRRTSTIWRDGCP